MESTPEATEETAKQADTITAVDLILKRTQNQSKLQS